ncbi:SMI1/KNR4 family protein [Saccharothrix variisporea]|uniref:Cell wall assembly regulator SMI1 n=1 Tax=Saccharothrix variisporea TaxID=543527 RepID=A0A495X5U9_9PSEU|nr:SMI1/KNR4 family protein [Saccharothrix variisporea]RKT69257.1 cell wall assembly regulator SMI1 [Saccharothrix variisporea]
MSASVTDSWARITTWLRAHAPSTFDSLAPPADERDLAALASDVPTPLPDDLATWWRLCDGSGLPDGRTELLPPYFEPCSTKHALEKRRYLVGPAPARTADPVDEAGTRSGAFLKTFVPIAALGNGDHLFVDLRPGRWHGCVHHWSRDDGSQVTPFWDNVADMLTDIANALHTGSPALRSYVERARPYGIRTPSYVPAVEEGCLVWRRST